MWTTLGSVFIPIISILGADAGSLFSPIAISREGLACCEGDHILSCEPLKLDPSALGDANLELAPIGATLNFEGMVEGSSDAYHYGNDDMDAVMTYNADGNDLYGHVNLNNGQSYVIEYCGDGVHVLKELDVDNLGENEGVDNVDDDETDTRILPIDQRAAEDRSTIVTYTIKVYYTPQFRASTSDIRTFVNQVIMETNQGYINSKVPLRAKLHCIEAATINDQNNSGAMLRTFKAMKGTTDALRGTADTAALLVNSFSSCGIAYFDTIRNGNTVSVTAKNCALGYYSFGHEIGHNIGLTHNKEASTNSKYSHGHGHLIAKGSASTGYRTIMAYYANGHRTRVNYYSNPYVRFPTTRTPTGVWGVSNNAKILTDNRFSLAAVGDESNMCGYRPTTTTTTTTTRRPAPSCSVEGYFMRYQYAKISSSMYKDQCKANCKRSNSCYGWIHGGYTCYHLLGYTTAGSGISSGPPLNSQACSFNRDYCENRGILRLYRYASNRSSSGAHCANMCRGDRNCSYWIYSSGYCRLHQNMYQNYSGWTSGPRVC